MANLEIKSPPEFNLEVRKLETSDRGHPDSFNPQFQTLVNNDAYLYAQAGEASLHAGNASIHVTPEDKAAWYADATTTTPGRMSPEDKVKLNAVAGGAEVNQNAYSNVKAGGVVIAANSKTAQVEFVAGSNISITGDNTSKRVTVTANLPSTMAPSAHNQSASTITSGTFAGNVTVPAGTDYTTSKLRNIKMQSSAPASLANGEICLVYT